MLVTNDNFGNFRNKAIDAIKNGFANHDITAFSPMKIPRNPVKKVDSEFMHPKAVQKQSCVNESTKKQIQIIKL